MPRHDAHGSQRNTDQSQRHINRQRLNVWQTSFTPAMSSPTAYAGNTCKGHTWAAPPCWPSIFCVPDLWAYFFQIEIECCAALRVYIYFYCPAFLRPVFLIWEWLGALNIGYLAILAVLSLLVASCLSCAYCLVSCCLHTHPCSSSVSNNSSSSPSGTSMLSANHGSTKNGANPPTTTSNAVHHHSLLQPVCKK